MQRGHKQPRRAEASERSLSPSPQAPPASQVAGRHPLPPQCEGLPPQLGAAVRRIECRIPSLDTTSPSLRLLRRLLRNRGPHQPEEVHFLAGVRQSRRGQLEQLDMSSPELRAAQLKGQRSGHRCGARLQYTYQTRSCNATFYQGPPRYLFKLRILAQSFTIWVSAAFTILGLWL